MFTVFFIGNATDGSFRDGEIITRTETEREAGFIAEKLYQEKETLFHPTYGGIGICDEDGEIYFY